MRIFYLLLFVLLCTCVRAQRNWQLADLVLTDGQRRSGQINDRGWDGEITEIEFRTSEGDAFSTYTPDAVERFSIGERRWISKNVEVDGAPGRVSDLAAGVKYEPLKKQAFLEVLREGQVSLYVYNGPENRGHYFLQGPTDAEPVYLQYRPRLVSINGSDRFRAGGGFRAQLAAALTPACPKVSGRISKMQYTGAGLRKLIDQYYDCTGQEAAFKPASGKVVLQLGPMIGVESGRLITEYPPIRLQYDEAAFVSPVVGLDVRALLPILNQRMSFFASAFYSRFKLQRNNIQFEQSTGFVEQRTLSHRGVMAQVGVGYQLIQGPVSLGLRVALQATPYSDDRLEQTNYIDGMVSFAYPVVEYPKNSNSGFSLGVTASYRDLQLIISGRRNARINNGVVIYNSQRVGASLVYYLF